MARRSRSVAPRVEAVEGRLLPSASVPAPSSTPADVGPVAGVTDPSAITQGDTTYVFSSGPGIAIRASDDLTHWREVGQVFDAIPAWAQAKVPGATSIWAPDVSFAGGEYRVYYAVSTFGSRRSVIGLAVNTTLDPAAAGYHWVDRGEVVESRPGRDNFNAIDPNIATDALGNVWLTFGSLWGGIKQLRIDPATGLPLTNTAAYAAPSRAPKPLSLAARPRSQPIEAPFIVSRNGLNYLFVSFDVCCRGVDSTYKIMVGRSASVNGPFVDRSGRPMTRGGGTPVLVGSGRWRGPGSNGVVTADGRDWLVLHAYDALNGGVPTLQFRPLVWTPDGWPVAGDPLF